jgi:hypothetical protein
VIREKFEKLGSIFLAAFSIGLAVVMAADGLEGAQLFGSLVAVLASTALAVTVRVWPRDGEAEVGDSARR